MRGRMSYVAGTSCPQASITANSVPNQPQSAKPWVVSATILPSAIRSTDSGVTSLVKTATFSSPITGPSLASSRRSTEDEASIAPRAISLEGAQKKARVGGVAWGEGGGG